MCTDGAFQVSLFVRTRMAAMMRLIVVVTYMQQNPLD